MAVKKINLSKEHLKLFVFFFYKTMILIHFSGRKYEMDLRLECMERISLSKNTLIPTYVQCFLNPRQWTVS